MAVARGFALVWTIGLGAILIFGTATIIGCAILLVVVGPGDAQTLPMGFAIAGFAVAWITIGSAMWSSGAPSLIQRRDPRLYRVRCVCEFVPPGHDPVRLKATALISSDSTEEPPQPVLYDPARPSRASTLTDIDRDLEITPWGDWVVPHAQLAVLKLCSLLSLVAGPILAWLIRL